jgi:predicted Rossmann-fold nucleotide-binding protein
MRIKEQPKSVIELLIDGHPIALRNSVFASESGVRCSVNGGTFTKAELRERIGLKQASHLAAC